MRNILPHKKAAFMAAFMFLGMLMTFPMDAYNKSDKEDNSKSYSLANPDFAFPQTVEKGAEKRLDKAIKDQNGVEAIRAAIQVIVARNLVSDDAFQGNIAMLDSIGKLFPRPYNSLFTLLQAGMYTQMYNTDQWTFNRRTLPLDSYPENVKAWSGDLFAQKVLQLVDETLKGLKDAEELPLSLLSPVMKKNDDTDFTGFTIADFIVSDCADILRNFNSVTADKVIPFRDNQEKEVLSPKEECTRRADEILDTRIRLAEESGNNPELAFFIYKKSQDLYGEEKAAFLLPWKQKLLDTQEGGMILSLYFDAVFNNNYVGSESSKELYREMRQWVDSYPSSRYAKAVKYDIAKLTQENVSFDMPSCLYPGTAGKGKMTVNNVNRLYALIYKVPESLLKNGSLVVKDFPGTSKCVATIPIEIEGRVPFSGKKDFEIPALPSGNYVIIPSVGNKLTSDWRERVEKWSMQVFRVTNLSIITTNDSRKENAGTVYVVDAMTQQPVAGADVVCKDNNGKVIKSGLTDADGGFAVSNGYFKITANKDGNAASLWSRLSYSKNNETKVEKAEIFTDLAIYRPGDSVRFSIVGWTLSDERNALRKNTPLKVVLLDANLNEKDSLSLTTDEWGRCAGDFRLPADGLLGTYQLAVEYRDNSGKRVGYKSFEVAEYKTPSFYVEMQKDSTSNYLPGDLIRFKGVVKTYSGMPLTGVEVKYNVRWSPWWRFRSSSGSASYGNIMLTDESGQFIIELPTENLKGTEFEWGIYTLSVSVTSDSGETQSAPDLRFALGNDLSVRPQISDKILVDSDSIRLNVPVYDMLNLPVVKEIHYRIAPVADPLKLSEGVFTSPSLSMKSSEFPSGEYYMEFNLVGDTVKTGVKTVFYRNDDVKCPVNTSLWVPESRIVAHSEEKSVNAKVGNGYPGSYILSIVSDRNGIISREWLRNDGEMLTVKVPVPSDSQKIWVTFSGMHDFNQDVAVVEIVPESLLKKMNVKTSVYRSNISAGDREVWKFRFTVGGDIQKDIPAFAVMTDKALNALAPFSWSFNNRITYRGSAADVSYNRPGRFRTEAHFTKLPRYAGVSMSSPDWNTYGYGLADTGVRVMLTSMKIMDSSDGATSRGSDGMVQEVEYETAAPRVYKAAAVASNSVMDVAEESIVSSDNSDAGVADVSDVELRPVEMPLAFFMPRLNADEKGEVTVAFEVPNYNTTWQFQLVGYNEEVMSANVVLDVVASKPVMVRSNPPRFVRTGDTMSVSATLFNNTDAVSAVSGRIELFDPTNDKILMSKDFRADNVTPSGNRAVSVEFYVPDNLSAIGIRSYALTDTFSDGEQTVIPVLPSSTPVIESTQFYLKTGETEYSVKLPKFGKNANLTLRYCDNPIWECLLALPSIAKADSKNVFSVTRALFANSMSQNVVEKYPMVKENLAKVFAENDTTLLTSNLQKDSELKTVTLNNTPWVNDAASETQRMRGLDKLLDKSTVDATVSTLLTDLKGLQNADGGWSWCPDMKTSYFITRSVILQLGMMKRAGCLPSDALAMAKKAISYCDAKAYDDYLKSDKKFSVYDMLNYLYARSFFDNGNGKTSFNDLKKRALKEISEEWKDFSIYGKAVAAILMSRSKGYEKTARVILESLNQYASKDEAKGWWYDNLSSGFDGIPKLLTTAAVLEAYNEIEPDADAVEGLRQWLVLQKETENWGANSYTVEVISAIMGSDADWTIVSEPVTFRIDSKEIEVENLQMLTGMVTFNLDPSKVSGKTLSVSKHSDGPAWGGVVSQYVAPIKDVKAERCENLKIEKQLFVVTDTPAGEVAKEGEIHVGDKVRVTLTLTCDKDMDYVAVIDERGAFLEPADQVSGYDAVDNMFVYKEIRDNKTSFFIDFLPKGVNVISYDCYADRQGAYSVGIASVQSQYSPLQTAHSAGKIVEVK